ncbi:response regulator [Mesorhizobium sp. 43Arga]
MTIERSRERHRVLVVEDEFTIVLTIEDVLLDLGLQIVGPAARLDVALDLARSAEIEAAVLDINIRGGNSYTVADILAERGIPFLFCSGYSEWALEERHRHRPRLSKPFSPTELQNHLLGLLSMRPHQ